MYCYGLRQNPKSIDLVESMWRYFAEKAIYFNRDGEKLLNAMSCINDTSKLNGCANLIFYLFPFSQWYCNVFNSSYISSALSGELPETIIQYIGDNDVTGQLLFDYLKNNLKKVRAILGVVVKYLIVLGLSQTAAM